MFDLDGLPPALRRYVLLIIVTAPTAFLVTLVLGGDDVRVGISLPVVVGLTLATAIAGRFPWHLMAKTKVAADGVFLIALAFVCGPVLAMVAAAIGVGAAQLLRRTDRVEGVFNIAQTMLWVGGGSLAMRLLSAVLPRGVGITMVLTMLVTLVVMHLLNTLLIATAGALQEGAAILPWWRNGLWLEFPAEGAAGVAVASLAGAGPGWGLALVLAVIALALPLVQWLRREWAGSGPTQHPLPS